MLPYSRIRACYFGDSFDVVLTVTPESTVGARDSSLGEGDLSRAVGEPESETRWVRISSKHARGGARLLLGGLVIEDGGIVAGGGGEEEEVGFWRAATR